MPKEPEGVKKQKTLQEDARERATRPYDAVSSAKEPEVLRFQDIYLHVLEC